MNKFIKQIVDMYFDDHISCHSINEMATIGSGKWGSDTYKVSIHGASTADRDIPHIHIYNSKETNYRNPQFNFEISLLDILCKDEVNLIAMIDKTHKQKVSIKNRKDCSWQGYRDIKTGFNDFLINKPNKKLGNFIDNLDYTIYQWNIETDPIGYEYDNKNPLLDYIVFKTV